MMSVEFDRAASRRPDAHEPTRVGVDRELVRPSGDASGGQRDEGASGRLRETWRACASQVLPRKLINLAEPKPLR
jgi:hypothetical protein